MSPPTPERGTTARAKGGRTSILEEASCPDRTGTDRTWLAELLRPLAILRSGWWSH